MSDSRIYTTKDYSLFRLIPSNRPVTDASIAAKVRELKRKNLLRDFPIIVKKNGRHFDIYDGQNRFEAAKKLGLPIFYKISQTITVDDVAPLNTAQVKWKPKDYLSHFIARGNENYCALKEFVADSGISLSVAIGLVGGCERFGDVSAAFKTGNFKAKDTEHARIVGGVLNAFTESIPWATDRSFVLALSRIARASSIDAARVTQKLRSHGSMMVKCANWLQYVELIDKLYNYHARADAIQSIREDVRKWVVKNRPEPVK